MVFSGLSTQVGLVQVSLSVDEVSLLTSQFDLLTEAGISPSSKDSKNRYPLHFAAKNDNLTLMKVSGIDFAC